MIGKIIKLLITCVLFVVVLSIGGYTLDEFKHTAQIKDPSDVFSPLVENIPEVELPGITDGTIIDGDDNTGDDEDGEEDTTIDFESRVKVYVSPTGSGSQDGSSPENAKSSFASDKSMDHDKSPIKTVVSSSRISEKPSSNLSMYPVHAPPKISIGLGALRHRCRSPIANRAITAS